MQVAPEIKFHDIDRSEWVENYILERLRRLERFADGLVEKLSPDGYGFIRSFDNLEVYFHRNSVLHGDFERLTVGTEVRFEPEEGDKGLQASSVQIVAKPGALSETPEIRGQGPKDWGQSPNS